MENHLDISKNFIPYDLALELKELGFDEICFGFYDLSYKCRLAFTSDQNSYEQQKCSAPLYQQAFRWFREKYNLHYIVYKNINIDGYDFCEITIDGIINKNTFKTYEEAELECLVKLIDIVKRQNVK